MTRPSEYGAPVDLDPAPVLLDAPTPDPTDLVIDIEVERKRTSTTTTTSQQLPDHHWLSPYDATSSLDDFLWQPEHQHDGISNVNGAILEAFLKLIDVTELYPQLVQLGAAKLKDLEYLTADDLYELGAAPESAERLLNAVRALRRASRPVSKTPTCLVS